MNRVQMRRGVKLPPGTKYVGRGSRWGNPWRIGGTFDGGDTPVVVDREMAVALYREWAAAQLFSDPGWLEPFRGHDLACYCPLDQPCHADVLLELLG